MESSYTPHCTRNRGPSFQLAALLWICIWRVSVTESAALILLRGEVGGNVTFHCPVDKTRTIKLIYYQLRDKFVNGYHTVHPDTGTKTWDNTRVDRNMTHMDMMRLNISHNGVYKCIIQYSDSDGTEEHSIKLTVTANYSTPSEVTSCDGGHGCFVTCSSHGGYPETKMRLITNSGNSSSQMFREVNSSQVSHPSSMLFTSSSTTYVNCTEREWKDFSCSVGDVTSRLFSVCPPKSAPEPGNTTPIIIACVVIAVIILSITAIVIYRYRKKRAAAPRQICNTNGGPHETISLRETQEENEAP